MMWNELPVIYTSCSVLYGDIPLTVGINSRFSALQTHVIVYSPQIKSYVTEFVFILKAITEKILPINCGIFLVFRVYKIGLIASPSGNTW